VLEETLRTKTDLFARYSFQKKSTEKKEVNFWLEIPLTSILKQTTF